MISWIQKYFQHHFKLVFMLVLAAMAIPLVLVINSSGGARSGERRVVERPFFGHNIALQEEVARISADAQLSFSLNPRYDMMSSFEDFANNRVAALYLADEWHIPATTEAEVTDAIKKARTFSTQDGQFDAKKYNDFRDSLKTNQRGFTEGDIRRVLEDDVRAAKVEKLLAGPGYVQPADIKTYLARSDTTWTIGTATVDAKDIKADVKPADADLQKFYEQNSGHYQIPPRIVVSYVPFLAASYADSIKVTDAEVREYYNQNPARFPKPAEPKPADAKAPATPPKADPNADFPLVRANVEAALKLERAQALAVKAAGDFAVQIFETFKNQQPDEGTLTAFLARNNLQQKPIAPFPRDTPPAEFAGAPDALSEAAKLNAQHFASEAFATPAGAAVMLWKQTQPPRQPLFNEVKDKVAADYTDQEKQKRLLELGKTIKAQLEARLKAGDTLEKAAAAVATSTGTKIEAKMIPAFTARTRPQDLDPSAFGPLERLEKGQVSDMVQSADKGLFVYAADKKLPDVSEANPRYVELRNQLATYTASENARSILGQLVQQELKKSEPKAE